ncbi:MAG TPA: MFS transporter [Anaerolineales bacterium]|nr:MFS transporter [Anaerolineales bacterium]
MPERASRYRWFVVAVFFAFMLLHQTDRLMIGPMQDTIEKQFSINDQQWGFINSGALLVGTILYPVWGYLYDRYARAKLLALASFIWGATTWISAIAPNYRAFLLTRATTGIDDSAYPGLYSLVADYFGPTLRGKIYGLLQLAQPMGYLIGMVMALIVAPLIGGWRQAFYITGTLGLVVAAFIYFGVKEMPRGKAEPEFEGMEEIGQFRFSWREAAQIFRKKTMWFVFLQGFVGVFPWNVITFFFFGYLMTDRGYDNNAVLATMAPVIIILAAGYFVGGYLGDWLFKRTHKGRIIISSLGVLLGAVFLYMAMTTPVDQPAAFFLWMSLTAIFMPLSSPNVVATVYDITVPEVRSTAQAVEYFVENIGAAFAPILAGVMSVAYGKGEAILWICIVAWVLCFFFYLGALLTIEGDIGVLRAQMAERAAQQKA